MGQLARKVPPYPIALCCGRAIPVDFQVDIPSGSSHLPQFLMEEAFLASQAASEHWQISFSLVLGYGGPILGEVATAGGVCTTL